MSIVENGRKSKPQDSNIPDEEEFDIVSRNTPEKPNYWPHLQIGLIILLIASGAFGIGKYGQLKRNDTPVTIHNGTNVPVNQVRDLAQTQVVVKGDTSAKAVAAVAAVENPTSGEVVASKLGKKYHFPWCSGAKRISPANKVVFKNSAEARKARYAPASNCKGLQ